VHEALQQLKEVKDQITELEEIKDRLTDFLAECDEDDLHFTDDSGLTWSGSVTRATRPIVNLPMLRKLHPWLADRITSEVIDSGKLNQSLDQGLWTEDLRDAVVTMKQSRPGVRIHRVNTTTQKDEVPA
jgi:hypothetical protein